MSTKDPEVCRCTSKRDKSKVQHRTFGDTCGDKDKNVVRVCFQNINGFGKTEKSVKSNCIKDLIIDKQFDIMAMAEMNLNWSKLGRSCTLPQVCKRWFERSKTVVAYNQHEKRKKFQHQPGGTAVVSRGQFALRVMSSHFDDKRLGRWSSQLFEGKGGIKTRVVAVYVPVITSNHGHKKVACQQQRALLAMGIKENVIEVFWSDFWKQIDSWLEEGNQLIIGGDWNRNVTNKKWLEHFKKRNLLPAMSTRHGYQLPETHNNGSVPIDEIFYSSTLQVAQAGYLEHGSSLSDHRPLWIDIDINNFIGSKPPVKPTYAARRLKTNDPRVVGKYKAYLHQLLLEHDLYYRAEILAASITNQELNEDQQAEYEELDAIKTWAMKEAEKQCRKLKMGEIPWSPTLQKVRNRIEYLTLSMRRKLGRKVHAITLIRTSKKAALHVESKTAKQIEAMIKEEYKVYRKLKKNSRKDRSEYLESLAAALEKAGKGKKAKLITTIQKAEANRQMFRKLARINKKMQDLSTKSVTIQTPTGEKEITEKKELEEAIINSNRHKYHQTEDTCPFMKEPLVSDFGHLGQGPKTEKVLRGTYQPNPLLSPQTKDFIELCRFPEEEIIINPLNRSLTYFTKSWRKMKEKTSSRDVHFGHYKAAVDDKDLMQLHYNLAEIPFRTGYSPIRWRAATNVMILKKQGNTNVDKLRTLVLFESDFNHNNKFLGRSTMHHMIDNNLLAEEQYSAPGRKCIDHVINRHLFFDNLRYQKTSGAMAAVDLKSCYDRVSHSPAYLAMRSYGILKDPIISMFQSIQHMRYYTFTAHGMSSNSFGGLEPGFTAAPNGLGQGNGCAPTAWSVVSSKMFQVMHKRGASTTITSPLTNSVIDVCGFAYVDDTDLVTMSDGINDTSDAATKMQNTINEWEAVSKTTGGALVPSKCWNWIIGFDWNKDRWKYSKCKDSHSISVKDEKGKLHEMQMLDASMAKEMLGVSLSPDGNSREQVTVIKNKMKAYAEHIRTGHLNRHEAWINLSMIAMKTLEYTLPAMTLSQQQYNSIMAPVLRSFLPQMGLNRNFPRDLLYSPKEIQGLDVKSPYIVQGIHHVSDIAEHQWKQTLTGKLLQCNLEQLRIEIGDNEPILGPSFAGKSSYLLTESFVRSTAEFMVEQKVSLMEKIPKIPFLRENDECIMSRFNKSLNVSEATMKQLNKCRIYLRAFTLSDIVTGDGLRIRDEAWNGRQYCNGRNYKNWPIWGRPGLQAWATWRTALRKTFCTRVVKRLDVPLGNWIEVPTEWHWFSATLKSPNDILIEKTSKGYRQYRKYGRSKLQKKYSLQVKQISNIDGMELLPTTVKKVHNYYIKDEPCQINEAANSKGTNIRTQWLNVDPCRTGSVRLLVNALKRGSAIAVSDGSYLEEKGVGTASWVISTDDKKNMITARAISPGQARYQSSYRSEILGLLGILEELDAICKTQYIKRGKCRIFCDGISALHMVEDSTIRSISPKLKSCDLLSACVKLKASIPLELDFIHVKGHQDSTHAVNDLSTPAQLNVLMDTLAKNLLQSTTAEMASRLEAHPLSMSLPYHNTYIHQQFKDELYKSIMTEKGNDYWVSKGRYERKDIPSIAWTELHRAQKSTNRTRLRTITKWCADWIGTGKNMKKWNLRYNSNCALCGTEDEDTTHVLKCQHKLSLEFWDESLKEFDQSLLKLKTNYYLRRAIILELETWRKGNRIHDMSYADESLQQAIRSQQAIGWRTFLEGLVVQDIITYQHQYLKQCDSNLNGSTWAKRVIQASWKFLLKIWAFRNEKTHEKDNIDALEGIEALEEIITQEWERGLSKLPALEFTHLFRIKKKKLLKKSTEWKKDWLLTVKLGRQLYNDELINKDVFDTNPALREWIGLHSIPLKGRERL